MSPLRQVLNTTPARLGKGPRLRASLSKAWFGAGTPSSRRIVSRSRRTSRYCSHRPSASAAGVCTASGTTTGHQRASANCPRAKSKYPAPAITAIAAAAVIGSSRQAKASMKVPASINARRPEPGERSEEPSSRLAMAVAAISTPLKSTPFSREDGVDLSGVEIAATAIANLLDGSSLRSPGSGLLALMLAGTFMLAFACRLLPITAAAAIAVIAGAGYLLFARGQFAEALWWPVVVPLAVQTPAALALGLWLQYRDVRRERDTIRRLLGVPAPNHALDELARNLGPLPNRAGVVFSTCLNGDIEGYTELSEQLGPTALLQLMNRYFETVFTPIQRNRGVVIDNIGDAMQAVWLSSRPAPELRGRALQAGLDIHNALRAFNALGDHPPMNVLLGLHCGEVAFGPWGAEDRKSTRLNSSHVEISYAVFCLKKKKKKKKNHWLKEKKKTDKR